MPDQPKVSVVVLSYNRPHLLTAALEGLSKQTYPNLEVTVVDNPSPRSKQVVAVVGQFPGIRLWRNPQNLGFVGGMNVGLRQATGEYICLSEDDVVLEPGYIAALVDYFLAHPHTGIASGILYHHQARTVLSAGGDFRLGNTFHFRFLKENEPEDSPMPRPYEVAFVSGSMVFGQRQFLLEELHGFRDGFFLYYEDLDLCHRAHRAGRPIMVVPQARGYHFEPPASRPSNLVEYHKYKNFYSVYFLHAPVAVLPGFVLRYGPLSLLTALLEGRVREALLMGKAWAYVLPRIPTFLRERAAAPVLPGESPGRAALVEATH